MYSLSEKIAEDPPAKLLDDLFRKTKAAPCIYWLPLTDEQVMKQTTSYLLGVLGVFLKAFFFFLHFHCSLPSGKLPEQNGQKNVRNGERSKKRRRKKGKRSARRG